MSLTASPALHTGNVAIFDRQNLLTFISADEAIALASQLRAAAAAVVLFAAKSEAQS